jgi:hypothetical protein
MRKADPSNFRNHVDSHNLQKKGEREEMGDFCVECKQELISFRKLKIIRDLTATISTN